MLLFVFRLKSEKVSASRIESNAVIRALVECSRYIISQCLLDDDVTLVESIIDSVNVICHTTLTNYLDIELPGVIRTGKSRLTS